MFPTKPNVMSETLFHSFIYQKRSYGTEVLYKKYVLKNFPKFTGKQLRPRLVFNKVAGLSPATWLKKDSSTDVFLWILWNFQEQLFLQNTSGGCFWFIWIDFIRFFLLNMTRKFTNLLHSEWSIIRSRYWTWQTSFWYIPRREKRSFTRTQNMKVVEF